MLGGSVAGRVAFTPGSKQPSKMQLKQGSR